MEDDRKKSLLIFVILSVMEIAYFIVNNLYSGWAFDPNTDWAVALIVYYTLTQPIYILVLYLMFDKWGYQGLIAAICLMVASDIASLPHSVQSLIFNQTELLPSDPNLAPYADWQIIRALSTYFGFNGIVNFTVVAITYVAIPTVLNLVAALLVGGDEFEEIAESM